MYHMPENDDRCSLRASGDRADPTLDLFLVHS